jgi:hypothetical protein
VKAHDIVSEKVQELQEEVTKTSKISKAAVYGDQISATKLPPIPFSLFYRNLVR